MKILQIVILIFFLSCHLNPFDDEAEKKKKEKDQIEYCIASYLICINRDPNASEETKKTCGGVGTPCFGSSF